MSGHAIALALVLALAPTFALAGPLPKDKVPEPLKTWIPWALHGHQSLLCPVLGEASEDEAGDAPGCAWTTRLELTVDGSAGRFSFGVTRHSDGFVRLPGDARRFPQDVRSDGRPAPVLERDGAPAVHLEAGTHAITGSFTWKELPESLPLPPELGLLSLTLKGRPVPFPVREGDGMLWLQRDAGADAVESRLEVVVHRKLVDGSPLLVVTRVRLDVSGKDREALLGRALLPGTTPLSLEGPLPARLEADGRLRVQVRPGTFTLTLTARLDQPVAKLELGRQPEGASWAGEEIWVFAANPSERVVELSGAPQLDASQTTLGNDWRHLPAYRLAPGDALAFTQQRRGDEKPAPDQLSLRRTLWVDFDGRGLTAKDELSGALTRSFRLDMPEPAVLGRVTLGGRDQLITRSPSGAPGVEVRAGRFALRAQSRFEGSLSKVPAVAWGHDVQSLSAELVLPPGFRLLHASGVDDVSQTWLLRWTLLDLFIVLIVALAFGRLFGLAFGALAFAALGLAIPEGSPSLVFLFALAAEALVRVVPSGRLLTAFTVLRVASWTALAVLLVPFAVHHVRGGLYPALEQRHDPGSYASPPQAPEPEAESGLEAPAAQAMEFAQPPPASPAPPKRTKHKEAKRAPPEKAKRSQSPADEMLAVEVDSFGGGLGLTGIGAGGAGGGGIKHALGGKGLVASGKVSAVQSVYAQQIDPDAIVQTGAGVPSWSWRSVRLSWSGPVAKGSELSLWLLPPGANLVLALLRVLLLAALLGLLIVRRSDRSGPAAPAPSISPAAAPSPTLLAVLLALAQALAPTPALAQTLPSEERLTELRQKLTERPACHPQCAEIARLTLTARESTLSLRLEIGALAATPVALPGALEHWTPEKVTLDGAPAKELRREGDALYLLVPAGVHTVELTGALPPRDDVQLPLPQKPRRVVAQLAGFTLDGVRDDGTAEDALQLVRVQRGAKSARLEPGQLPPFAHVDRTLRLGLTWELETRVSRRSPAGTPIVLDLPLVAGESITTADVRAENGRAKVTIGPRANEVVFRGTLKPGAALALAAPQGASWTETWRLDVSPVWHVETTGLPPVLAPPAEARLRTYVPWPGESLTLAITRPEAVKGPSLTVQQSHLVATPGVRATDVELQLSVSTSRGGPFTVTLPDGAELQTMSLGGVAQPLRQEGAKAMVVLPPGEQVVSLTSRVPVGLSLRYRTPAFSLTAGSVNANLELKLARDRWVLFAGGPRLGPAVLFWSLFVVLILAGLGLSRVPLVPLSTVRWVLLAVGLSQVDLIAAALAAGFLLVIGLRGKRGAALKGAWRFNLLQLLLAAWSLGFAAILFSAIRQGLLGAPEMQVQGNGSTAMDLRWFSDRSGPSLPEAWILSVPVFVYRMVMLAWALWLAATLLELVPWAWNAFSSGGVWRARERKVVEARPVPDAGPSP